MSRRRRRIRLVLGVSVSATVIAAAFIIRRGGDPEQAAAQHAARAEAFVQARQFDEALIEYGNAIKRRPDWSEAYLKRANVFRTVGKTGSAYEAYARAAALDPSNIDAHLQAGRLLLGAGEFAGARTHGELALRAAPRSAAAHILLGNALAGQRDVAQAVGQIEQAIALDPSYAPAWAALGAVQILTASDQEKARDAFERAVTLAPRAADAHLALANYQWAIGETAAAEKTLLRSIEIDAKHVGVRRTLGLLYETTNRAPLAEPQYRTAATVNGAGAVMLAEYYLRAGRAIDALQALKGLDDRTDPMTRQSAELLAASAEAAADRTADAHARLDAMIERQPNNPQPRVLKARVLLTEGQFAAASQQARLAIKAEPGLAQAHYVAGVAARASGNAEEALEAFAEVARLNPRAAAPSLQIADLELTRGRPDAALRQARRAAELQPEAAGAVVLVARSLRAQNNVAQARHEIVRAIARHPSAAPLHAELGAIALVEGKPAEARAAFERANRLDPALHDARAGLVAASLASGAPAAARTYIDRWIQESPDDPSLRVLSARTLIATRDYSGAEQVLRQAIVSDPTQLDAYELLGRLYIAQQKLDAALTEYRALAERSARPAAALTMSGMLHEAQMQSSDARAQYERALNLDPRAGVAANNLAWMYAQDGKLDEALRLATMAREVLGPIAQIEDTVGWILYRQGTFGHAIESFERAVERAPQRGTYHLHLGLAMRRAGDPADAKASLERALTLGLSESEAAEATAALRSDP